MNAFLWAILIVGILDIGGICAYLMMGKWPIRTKEELLAEVCIWLVFAIWALVLIVK